MAKGMEMVMSALRNMIPPEVWAAVERNIVSMGDKVAAIEKRLAGIEEKQDLILQMLKVQNWEASEDGRNQALSETETRGVPRLVEGSPNGEANSTAHGPEVV